jgi:hypothetical protein
MNVEISEMSLDRWLASYKDTYRNLLINDPEFARWLDKEYVPIAGGWQY